MLAPIPGHGIGRGPLRRLTASARTVIALEEALGIAKQIADGLEAAHEKAITHRDLKSANVKIPPDGSVKGAGFWSCEGGRSRGGEFGFAHADVDPRDDSRHGSLSPELARGNPVDKPSCICSFGMVPYEMLTGKISASID